MFIFKKLLKKTNYYIYKIDNHLYKYIFSRKINFIKPFFTYFVLKYFLKKRIPKKRFAYLWSTPTLISQLFASIGVKYNINNLGNSYSINEKDLSIGHKIEKEVIEWLKTRINQKDNYDIEGYITSGGTESNLFLAWIGRDKLLRLNNIVRPVLVISNFTHYSIRKAARILSISEFRTSVSNKSFGINGKNLEKTINELVKKGHTSIILPITIGYSSTGASDEIEEIIKVVKLFKENNNKILFYLWVDTAAQGLPFTYLKDNFSPMNDELIEGCVIDFHKFGSTPIPSGIVLYRSKLKEIVETKIDYLSETDCTISGSRPASSAFSIWANFCLTKESKIKNKYLKLLDIKNKFVDSNNQLDFIGDKDSLVFAVNAKNLNSNQRLDLENKYKLLKHSIFVDNKNTQSLDHYKICITSDGKLFT